jgi:NAD(P)-dependent dehydrogenase (short-subunit alcohol dehydrogenase family)
MQNVAQSYQYPDLGVVIQEFLCLYLFMILITGCSSGIGLALALSLSKKYKILAGYRKDSDLAKISKANIIPIKLDVTNTSDLDNLKSYLNKNLSNEESLQAVINNAGIVMGGPVEFFDLQNVKNVFNVNVWGALEIIQITLPHLRKSNGRIINISSISGRTVTPFLSPYNASKYSLEVFSDALRMELLNTSIKVVLIEPGSIETPIWEKSLEASRDQEKNLPIEAEKYYGKSLKSFKLLADYLSKKSSKVDLVIDKVKLALEANNPKARYLVGLDAKISSLLHYLPTKFRDRLIWNQIHKFK